MNQRWSRVITPSVRSFGRRAFCKEVIVLSARQRGTLCVFLAAVLYSIGGLFIKLIPWGGMAINGGRTAVALVVIDQPAVFRASPHSQSEVPSPVEYRQFFCQTPPQ